MGRIDKLIYNIKRLWQFLTYGIWRATDASYVNTVIKTILLCFERSSLTKLSTRASALTLRSMFSIVPIFAVLFAVARGFGLSAVLEDQMRITMEAQKETLNYLFSFANSYLSNAQNGLFIGVGVIVLLWTVIALMNNIELAFNDIWRVKKQRSVYRKLTDYLFMFMLIPLLLLVSGTTAVFTSSFTESTDGFAFLAPILRTLIKISPYLISWLAFTILYLFMPNTKVKFKYALLAGIVAGTANQAFQFIYINGQTALSAYNNIYGSFAAIPLFLLWMQTSWSICLFGVILNYSSQNLVNFNFADDSNKISRRYYDFVLLSIMSLIVKRFMVEGTPYTIRTLSDEHKFPLVLTSMVIDKLQDLGLIHEVMVDRKYGDVAYLPSVDPSSLSVGDVIYRIDKHGSENFGLEGVFSCQWNKLADIRSNLYENLNSVLIKDLTDLKE